jgi:AcrR family transcriptional regulator
MVRITKAPIERRQEIIATARRLFQTEDYDTITMQKVVEELGIAKGTLFYYFDSKEDLLKAVVEDIIGEDSERKRALIAQMHDKNALEKIRALMQLDSMAAQNPIILESLHKPGNAGMHTQLLAVSVLKEAQLYAALITQGCEEGIFHTNNPLECAEFIISGIQFLTDNGIYPWTEADIARRAQALPALVEAVLKAQPGSFKFMVERIKE